MDNTGTRFDFTVTAGLAEELAWEFRRTDGAAFDLSGATFEGVVVGADGAAVLDGMKVEHGAETGRMAVTVRDMAAGVYRYEVYATSPGMERARVLYGALTAVSSEAALLRIQDAGRHAYRTLRLLVPDEVGAPLLLSWLGSTAAGAMARAAATSAGEASASAEAAAGSAAAAADSAAQAEASAEAARSVEVTGLDEMRAEAARIIGAARDGFNEQISQMSREVQAVNAVIAVWDGKIQTAVVLNPQTETLWIGGVDTGCRYQGEPGRCPRISARETWEIWKEEEGAWYDTGKPVRGQDGFSPYINAHGHWVVWNPLTGEPEDSGRSAVGRDGKDGAAVRRYVIASEAELPESGELCRGWVYFYVPLEEDEAGDDGAKRYKVYAWLESLDGNAGWNLIGEACDLATAECAGLVRLGTDLPCLDGAPVGNNAHGQMTVPRADFTVPGTVMPSTSEVLGTGGLLGYNGAGRLVAQVTGFGRYGAGKPGTADAAQVACVGLLAEGGYGCTWATLYRGGAVKLGSQLDEHSRQPYLVGVGATSNHELANNLLYGGALQHRRPQGWVTFGMDWLDEESLMGTAYYMGLATSDSFTQSEERGLELVAAGTGVLGGVVIASGASDTRSHAVFNVAQLKEWVMSYAATSAGVYTKAEADARYLQVSVAGATYATKAEVASTIGTTNANVSALEGRVTGLDGTLRGLITSGDSRVEALLNTQVSTLNAGLAGKVDKTERWTGDVVLTQAEYDALPEVDPLTKYYIVEE